MSIMTTARVSRDTLTPPPPPPASGPLAGYQLYCLTFSTPPVAAAATSDGGGNVLLTFAAKDVPVGCFILDAMGNTTATVVFVSGSTSVRSVSFGASTDLGTITVDKNAQVASAPLPAAGKAAPPPKDLPCPLGTWEGTAADKGPCGAPVVYSSLAAQRPDGKIIASTVVGPTILAKGGPCTYFYLSAIGDYAGGKVTMRTTSAVGGCASGVDVQEMVLDATCTTATTADHWEGCGTCAMMGAFYGCNGCGTMSCPANPSFTVTKK